MREREYKGFLTQRTSYRVEQEVGCTGDFRRSDRSSEEGGSVRPWEGESRRGEVG